MLIPAPQVQTSTSIGGAASLSIDMQRPSWWHCELWCHHAKCADLSGDIAHECGGCPSPSACNPNADGFVYSEQAGHELKRHNEALQRRVVRRRIRKRQAALRPQRTLSSGCVVYEHAQLNASLSRR